MAWKCGHPRTLGNTMSGAVPHCAICRRERDSARRQARIDRDISVVEAWRAGERIDVIARAHALRIERVQHILCENGIRSGEQILDPLYATRAIKVAADHVGYDVEVLIGPWRWPDLAQARYAVMAGMYRRGSSMMRIARRLGRTDHSTVHHGIRRAAELALRYPEFAALLAKVDAA